MCIRDSCCKSLQVEVDVGVQRIRRLGRDVAPPSCLANDAPARVDLHEVRAFLAAQLLFVLAFEPRLADLLTRLVAAVLSLVELRLRDFARVCLLYTSPSPRDS